MVIGAPSETSLQSVEENTLASMVPWAETQSMSS